MNPHDIRTRISFLRYDERRTLNPELHYLSRSTLSVLCTSCPVVYLDNENKTEHVSADSVFSVIS